MNFFKSSLFSDFKLPAVVAEHPRSENESESSIEGAILDDGISQSDAEPSQSADNKNEDSGVWGFGGLVKSLTLKSEEMLQAYRRDLQEFSTGLKEETKIIAEVAAHAVKDLPSSFESGAYVAQESLESVGQAIEDLSSSVWRGTAEIIAQGKEAVLRVDDDDRLGPVSAASVPPIARYENAPLIGGKYSRFEAQVMAMQHDSSTYCDEPEDQEDYIAWKMGFNIQDKRPEIDSLLKENTFLQELVTRFVPGIVTEEDFWTRYFYRLHKLRQTEEARADLVKRAASLEEEEDLGWDTDEEVEGGSDDRGSKEITSGMPEEIKEQLAATEKQSAVQPLPQAKVEDVATGGSSMHDNVVGSDNASVEVTVENSSSRETAKEEEDLGWEVAEDVESSSNDGKISSSSEASWEVPDVPKEDLKRRFAAQEDEEDLSWDVDDGDGEVTNEAKH